MKFKALTVGMLAAATLAGCVSVPTGPSVMVLPGEGRPFDQFRYDESDCRNFAGSQAGSAEQAQADSMARSAVLGTVVGALAGAAFGGNSNAAGAGAAVGLGMGAVAGSGAANASAYSVQRRYDMAYQQCMYAKGHKVAGYQARASTYSAPNYAPSNPPPVSHVPPPGSAPNYPPATR
jgi:hypothetical protein